MACLETLPTTRLSSLIVPTLTLAPAELMPIDEYMTLALESVRGRDPTSSLLVGATVPEMSVEQLLTRLMLILPVVPLSVRVTPMKLLSAP